MAVRHPARSRRNGPRWVNALYAVLPLLFGTLVVIIASQVLGNLSKASELPPADATVYVGVTASPIESAGCGGAPTVAIGTSAEQTLKSGGQTRTYRLHVPTGYNSTVMTSLVLNFHGDDSTDVQFEGYTGMSQTADQDGFLVVYPQGLPGTAVQAGWGGVGAGQPQVNDVRFVSDLLNALQKRYCIDSHRIYVTGFSRGGGMAALLACKLANRIAAFAPVSGAYFASVEQSCAPHRAVPILEFHGNTDGVVPYDGGGSENFLSVTQWLSGWTARDHCHRGPATFSNSGGATGEEWTGCDGNALVEHYIIDGGTHAWPNGGAEVLVASDVAWDFFTAHPLP